MGEPGLPANHLIPTLKDAELTTLVKHQFPGSIVDRADEQYVVLSVHGVGKSEREALENSLTTYNDMKRDGASLCQMLDDVNEDLRTPGMSRARHDSLLEILEVAESAVNAGVITHTVPWIMVPSYTRQIEELKRRVTTRLNMVAQELQQREKAKSRAGQKFPRPQIDEGATTYQQLKARIKD